MASTLRRWDVAKKDKKVDTLSKGGDAPAVGVVGFGWREVRLVGGLIHLSRILAVVGFEKILTVNARNDLAYTPSPVRKRVGDTLNPNRAM